MCELMISSWKDLPGAPPTNTEIGQLEEVPDGGAQFYVLGSPDVPFHLLVLRSGEEVFSYVNRCPHFGVPLSAKVDLLPMKPHRTLSCNVHYARFRWRDGYCEFGDCAGESLLPVPVSVVDDVLRIAA